MLIGLSIIGDGCFSNWKRNRFPLTPWQGVMKSSAHIGWTNTFTHIFWQFLSGNFPSSKQSIVFPLIYFIIKPVRSRSLYFGWCQLSTNPYSAPVIPCEARCFKVPLATRCLRPTAAEPIFSGKRSGQGCGRCASRSVGKPNVVGTIFFIHPRSLT